MSGIANHLTPAKQRVKIITVDPSTRRVEATLKDGAMIQIAVWEIPAFFRWPKEGEFWTVTRQKGVWMLDALMQESDAEQKIEDLNPGSAKIHTDDIKTESGRDVVHTTNNTATTGVTHTYATASGVWSPGQLTTAGIADGAVTTPKITDGAVTEPKYANPVVTSLPANPLDGQICYFLADGTQGVVWQLKYRAASASAYKWEFVGGSPLLAEHIGTFDSVTSGSYAPLSIFDGPNLILPLAGDWDISLGIDAYLDAYTNNGSSGYADCHYNYSVNGAAPIEQGTSGNLDLYFYHEVYGQVGGNFAGSDTEHQESLTRRITVTVPNSTLNARARRSGTSPTAQIGDRWITARPVRVG